MELWIRSQDKMVLTRNVGLRIVIEQEGASIIDETNDYILGMYNSEKRALEILDEIQNILKPIIYNEPIIRETTSPTDHYKKYECVEYLQTIQGMSTYVYEMPED